MPDYKVQIAFRGTLTKRKLLHLLADMPDETPVRITAKVVSANRAVEVANHGSDDDVYLSLAPTAEYIANLGCTLTAYCPD